ncbi:MAG: L,D-transpeptidase [Nitratireductor sp.]|jgi:lipoprotein-anchoring transpeptidase ErfK/SrfK|nr:L,D-transpeptidase [Nitratireductor sp.]
MMIDRRRFTAAGLSALALGTMGALGASPAAAAKKGKLTREQLEPRLVRFEGDAGPGEIHVLPDHFVLLWTLGQRRAMRYYVGIGRPGLYTPGQFFVGAKKEWPDWTPTQAMIERDPEKYAKYAGGMPGGEDNPLGARALYLFTKEQGDTFLRIHGTNQPETIGTAVSNGCARLLNEQIIELYDQVPIDTRVVLYPKS